MTTIDSVTLEVSDRAAATEFYTALGLGDRVSVREADTPSNGFRAYTLSVVVSQPANADLLAAAALGAGAVQIKPMAKSFWGYGGVFRAPDGAIWKLATSSKKNQTEPSPAFDDVVLLIGAADVGASKRFYTDHGLGIDKSFANKYVQFDTPTSPIKLALYGYKALAKDAGVPPEGDGSHRLVIHGDAGAFVDPDGFTWEPSAA